MVVTVDPALVDEVETASRGLLSLSMRAMAEVDQVSATQLRALLLLQQTGPVNLSEFADRLEIATSSASRLVDRLAAAGHLTRTVPGHSRREVQLTLSAGGRRLLVQHAEARQAIFTELLTSLDPQERTALLLGLRAVTRAVGEPSPSTPPPPPPAPA